MSAVFGLFCRLRLSTTSIGSSSLLKCAGFVGTQEKRKISKVHHYFAVLLFRYYWRGLAAWFVSESSYHCELKAKFELVCRTLLIFKPRV